MREGAPYVTDMYRGIIKAACFMTPYLADYIRVRKLQRPIQRGRIWCAVPDEAALQHVVLPKKTPELVPYLSHPNGWGRDNQNRLMTCASDTSVKAALRLLLGKNDRPLARLHAFWTLEGLGEFTAGKNSAALIAGCNGASVIGITLNPKFEAFSDTRSGSILCAV